MLGGPSRELGERLYCFSFGAECKEVTYDSFVLAMSKLKSAIQSDNETFFLFTLFSESHDMEGGTDKAHSYHYAVPRVPAGSFIY